MTQQSASGCFGLREHKFLAFLNLLGANGGPASFQQQCARLKTWNDAFGFRSVGTQPLYTPKTPLQTELWLTAGLDDRRHLFVTQNLCDAIHARLPIREFTIPGDWRLSMAGSVPVSHGARVKMVQRDSQFSHATHRYPPSP